MIAGNQEAPKIAGFKRAMVLAAGLGKRMQPLTAERPKPLIEVAGKALIDHVLDRLEHAGIETAIVNIHYRANQMEAHLAKRRRPQIILSDERDRLLDSGGGVKEALPLLGQTPFAVCNSDSFWIEGGPQSNLDALFDAWDAKSMDILMLIANIACSVGFDGPGDYTLDSKGRLRRRLENEKAPFAYAGVLLIKPELFSDASDQPFSLNLLFDAAETKGRLFGHILDGVWLHVGTPAALAAAEKRIVHTT